VNLKNEDLRGDENDIIVSNFFKDAFKGCRLSANPPYCLIVERAAKDVGVEIQPNWHRGFHSTLISVSNTDYSPYLNLGQRPGLPA